MSLPADARHRWGLDDGGQVGYLDLGEVVLVVPGGIEALRSQVIGAISESDWEDARAGFGDSDLANE